jgi:hypothetical protein
VKKVINFVKSKLILISAVVVAILIGGATTAIVSASIPDSDGMVHACRLNIGGTIRVIDTDASQSCTGLETSINWSTYGDPIISGRVFYDVSTGAFSLDSSRSQNITSIYTDPNAPGYACLTFSKTPKGISITSGDTGGQAIVLTELKDSNGWSSDTSGGIAYVCSNDDPSANAGILLENSGQSSMDFFIQAF